MPGARGLAGGAERLRVAAIPNFSGGYKHYKDDGGGAHLTRAPSRMIPRGTRRPRRFRTIQDCAQDRPIPLVLG